MCPVLPSFISFWCLCLFLSSSVLSFFYTGFRFSSSSYLLSLGFVPFLLLTRLPLLCLDVGSSWCVSSYGFLVGGPSSFLFLCFGCFLFAFLRGFPSCFRFLGLFSSCAGVSLGSGTAGVSLGSGTAGVARFVVFYLFMHYSIMVPSLTAGSEYPSGGGGVLALRRFVT